MKIKKMSKLLIVISLVGVVYCQQTVDITTGPPPKDKPSVAGWGWYGETRKNEWKETHERLLNVTKQQKNSIRIVFLGDSITRRWAEDGKTIWDKSYANRGAYSYGVGSDSTRQVIWRIQNGELDGLHPQVLILNIGTNNLYDDHNAGNEEEIAEGIKVILNLVRAKLPDTHIILLGIFPRADGGTYYFPRITLLNQIIAKFDDGKMIHFLDLTGKFEISPERIRTNLYNQDHLHLITAGYQVWHDGMEPLLSRLLNITIDITKMPPYTDKPWVPGWNYWESAPTAWRDFHLSLVQQTKDHKANIKVVFLGDDDIAGWITEGDEVWNAHYVTRGAYNYGIGSDSTRQVLWRIHEGELAGLNPKIIVLNVGANNLYEDYNKGNEEEVALAIQVIVESLRIRLPSAHVILVGIVPIQNDYLLPKINLINKIISKLDNGKTVHFLDLTESVETSPEHLKGSLFIPGLNQFSAAGYQLWYEKMEPLFASLYNKTLY